MCLSYTDNLTENLGKNIVQEWEKFASSWRASLKNAIT